MVGGVVSGWWTSRCPSFGGVSCPGWPLCLLLGLLQQPGDAPQYLGNVQRCEGLKVLAVDHGQALLRAVKISTGPVLGGLETWGRTVGTMMLQAWLPLGRQVALCELVQLHLLRLLGVLHHYGLELIGVKAQLGGVVARLVTGGAWLPLDIARPGLLPGCAGGPLPGLGWLSVLGKLGLVRLISGGLPGPLHCVSPDLRAVRLPEEFLLPRRTSAGMPFPGFVQLAPCRVEKVK